MEELAQAGFVRPTAIAAAIGTKLANAVKKQFKRIKITLGETFNI